MWKMMEERWEMFNTAFQQKTQLCVQNAELVESSWEYRRESIWREAMKTKDFNMTHPERNCSRAQVLDDFLATLRSNFQSHTRIVPHRDRDKVKYQASLLRAWNKNLDPAKRQTQITNPVEWLQDLRRDSDPGLEDFEASGKKCKRCMATMKENSTRQWSVWRTSSKEWMNRWESMPIKSNQIGEQWHGSHRIIRTFTKSLGANYYQDSSPRSSCWPQR